MKLIVISTSGKTEGEPQTVTTLFENGLKTLHLRKPKFSTNQLKNYIMQIPREYHNRIIIHSHHNLAVRLNLKGIHLTKVHKRNKLKTAISVRILKLRKPDLLVTTSFSTLSGLIENEKKFDYVFLSPVFDSLTHKYQSGYSYNSLKTSIERSPHKVIARSGIDIPVIPEVVKLGFEGMAIYSAMWKKTNPVEIFLKFIAACKEQNIPLD